MGFKLPAILILSVFLVSCAAGFASQSASVTSEVRTVGLNMNPVFPNGRNGPTGVFQTDTGQYMICFFHSPGEMECGMIGERTHCAPAQMPTILCGPKDLLPPPNAVQS